MSSEKNWKYNIGFGQSMTSGMLAFHGSISFDDPAEVPKDALLTLLKNAEEQFKNDYKIASIIPNNMEKLGKGKKSETESK